MAGDLVVSTINGGAIGAKNTIINGNFGINQRGVSGTVTLSAGAYGHDRWKAGASGCTYTFATSNNVTTITITAGSLMQVIEGINLQSGTHTLSWAGTAQGRVDAGSYGGSGLTGTAVGGTNQTVEFGTGTVSLVQYEAGSVATPFEHRQYGQELALCQRYALMIKNGTTSIDRFGLGSTVSATTVQMLIQHPVQFRAAATLTTTGTASDYQVYSTAVTACSAAPTIGESSQYNSRINFITAGGLTGGQVSQCSGANTNAYLLFSAEL